MSGHRQPMSLGPQPFTLERAKWSYITNRCSFEEFETAVDVLLHNKSISQEIAYKVLGCPQPLMIGIPPEPPPPDERKP